MPFPFLFDQIKQKKKRVQTSKPSQRNYSHSVMQFFAWQYLRLFLLLCLQLNRVVFFAYVNALKLSHQFWKTNSKKCAYCGPHLTVKYWLSETMIYYIIVMFTSYMNYTVIIINTIVHCSVTLFKVLKKKSKIRLKYRVKQKSFTNPNIRWGPLCVMWSRENTLI